MWQQWTYMVLGVWITLTPFLRFESDHTFSLILSITGALIVFVSSISLLDQKSEHEKNI